MTSRFFSTAQRGERDARRSVASEDWSGRRGSNPRPTAWKAVTLPLSYSRPRTRSSHYSRALALRVRLFTSARPRLRWPVRSRFVPLSIDPPGWPAIRRSLVESGERRMVAREGLEPSKPLGRQIYSLLRLTASLPRQSCVCVGNRVSGQPNRTGCTLGRWSWRRDLNPRPADYKSAALPD
jgi:hypothetical protein